MDIISITSARGSGQLDRSRKGTTQGAYSLCGGMAGGTASLQQQKQIHRTSRCCILHHPIKNTFYVIYRMVRKRGWTGCFTRKSHIHMRSHFPGIYTVQTICPTSILAGWRLYHPVAYGHALLYGNGAGMIPMVLFHKMQARLHWEGLYS